jgi:NADPH:quinone reductase-like Zn-dependent oxidoreductase
VKLISQNRYGDPEVLEVRTAERPSATKSTVVIRVRAVAVTAPDAGFRRGQPAFARVLTGLVRPRGLVLCGSFAGVVESVGPEVTRFAVGDEVFGATPSLFGASAEFVAVPESAPIVARPHCLDAAAAAGLAYSFLTAMPFLRDGAQLERGADVLVNGASGSVGIAAVQVARYLGAKVTGVCSERNAGLVRSLGADQVIDYRKDNFTADPNRYDVVLDVAAKSSFEKCRAALKPKGTYLTSVPSWSAFTHSLRDREGKVAKMPATAMRSQGAKTDDLRLLVELAEAGKIRAITDRRFPLEQARDAHRYVESGQKSGDVVLEPEVASR